MTHDLTNEAISRLKGTVDALIEKGSELSRGLSVDEQYAIMRRIIYDGISKAISNILTYKETEIKDKELKEKKQQLEQFVYKYFDRKFSEYQKKKTEQK